MRGNPFVSGVKKRQSADDIIIVPNIAEGSPSLLSPPKSTMNGAKTVPI